MYVSFQQISPRVFTVFSSFFPEKLYEFIGGSKSAKAGHLAAVI